MRTSILSHPLRTMPAIEPLEARAMLTLATFTVDPAQSVLTLEAAIGGLPLATGNLSASFRGQLVADVTPGAIHLPANKSLLAANNTGNWQPRLDEAGTPANFGAGAALGSTAVSMAVRQLSLRPLTSAPLAIDGLGNISPGPGAVRIGSGTVDARVLEGGAYTKPLTGQARSATFGQGATLIQGGNSDVLTLPVDVFYSTDVYSGGRISLHLTGSIVATRAPASAVRGSISGRIFHDRDGFGTREIAEPGLKQTTVFSDTNNNRRLDPGEPSTVSDGAGDYVLGNLAPGVHTIRFIPPAAQQLPRTLRSGYGFSRPLSGFSRVPILPGDAITDIHFGVTEKARIFASTFLQIAGSSTSPLPGITLFADRNDNQRIDLNEPSGRSHIDGMIPFSVPAGKYSVRPLYLTVYAVKSPSSGFARLNLSPGAIVSVKFTLHPQQ